MTRMRLLACLAACALLGACATTSPPGPARPLKIAAWNLEHLAEHDGSGCRARSEADYAAMRAAVARLDADVVAFAEVESARAAERVFPPSEYAIVMSTRPPSARDSFCRRDATSGPKINRQDVGFAIRHGVKFTRHADVDALGLGDPDLRWGVDISLDGARPLRLLAVHLKSGCSSGDDREACPILFQQVPVLERWVAARHAEGVDFAVLGDWNRRLAVAGDPVWRQLNDDGITLVDAAGGERSRCVERYPDFIDHIVFDPGAAARMIAGSFEQFDYGVPEAEHLSDHCPIAVRVQGLR
ncbi:MAG: hypothetical protein J0L88_02915 [Xanthomonadales bacterium]|nr:hypothetical protein [Xanthomonadales bacterium]